MDTIQDIAYLQGWFDENDTCWITPYIENHFDVVSWNNQWNYMRQHLFFTKKIVEDDMLSNLAKQTKLLNQLAFGKSKIVVIEGGRGAGKTGDAAWIVDELNQRGMHKKMFFVKKGEKPKDLPKWLIHVEEIEQVYNNSLAILDESAIKYSSRSTWTDENKDFVKRLAILRHKGITVLVITQHQKMIDIGIRRLTDILIYKMGASLEHDGENADDEKRLVRERLKPRQQNETLVEIKITNDFFKFEHGIPDWFTDVFSKSFSEFNPEAETKRTYVEKMKYGKEMKEQEWEKKKEIELAKIEKMKELGLDYRPNTIKPEKKRFVGGIS
jgi:hypothetical protein